MTPTALRAAAADLGLHGAQMAKALGKTRRTWCRWLSGETPIPHWVAGMVEWLLKEAAAKVCRHADPRCLADPCPYGIYRVTCAPDAAQREGETK